MEEADTRAPSASRYPVDGVDEAELEAELEPDEGLPAAAAVDPSIAL